MHMTLWDYLHHKHAGATEVGKRHWITGTGVKDGFKQHDCGIWELYPDSLQEQQGLLKTDSSLWHHMTNFKHV